MTTAGCGPLFHAASDETWPRQAAWLPGFVRRCLQRLKIKKRVVSPLGACLARNAKSRLRLPGRMKPALACQAAWLLGSVETLPATSQNQKTRRFPAWCLPLPERKKQATPAKRRQYWICQAAMEGLFQVRRGAGVKNLLQYWICQAAMEGFFQVRRGAGVKNLLLVTAPL